MDIAWETRYAGIRLLAGGFPAHPPDYVCIETSDAGGAFRDESLVGKIKVLGRWTYTYEKIKPRRICPATADILVETGALSPGQTIRPRTGTLWKILKLETERSLYSKKRRGFYVARPTETGGFKGMHNSFNFGAVKAGRAGPGGT